MEDKGLRVATRIHDRSIPGSFWLLFWLLLSAAIPALAQQDQSSAALPARDAAIPNSGVTQPMRTSPADVLSSATVEPAPVAARATPHYSPMTKQERWQDYEQQNFRSYGAFFQAFFTGLGDNLGNVPHWDRE